MPDANVPEVWFSSSALPAGRVPVRMLSGYEGLNELFRFNVVLQLAPDVAPINDLMLADAEITIDAWSGGEDEQQRIVKGIIAEATISRDASDDGLWSLMIVPSLWRLTLSRASRVFEDTPVKEIIETVFGEEELTHFEFRLNNSLAIEPREFCTQFEETSFDFVKRLCEECGVFFTFEHDDADTVVIQDSLSKLKDAVPLAKIQWEPSGDAVPVNRERVYAAQSHGAGVSAEVMADDYDPLIPSTDMSAVKPVPSGKGPTWQVKHAGSKDPAVITRIAAKYADMFEAKSGEMVLETTCRSITAGCIFRVLDDGARLQLPFDLHDKPLAALSVSHSYGDGQYANTATVRFSQDPYRPPRVTPKPRILGHQTAMVVGESEVDVDEHGRVRVRFLWDKEFKRDHDSCRIRVAHGYAGGRHGIYFIPRLDDEVVVSFVDGDPDRPLIVGSVFNGDCEFPLNLPDQDERSILRMPSGMEVHIDEKSGEEIVNVMTPEGMHDIKVIGGKRIDTTAVDEVTLKGDKAILVESAEDTSFKTDQNYNLEAMQNITIESTGSGSIMISQGAGSIEITAGGEINIKGTRVTIEGAMGVDVTGALIKLN